ncbi:MAG: efflux RND transporter periplasmic adaptor subunit [Candidatus Brocadiia bacterium]
MTRKIIRFALVLLGLAVLVGGGYALIKHRRAQISEVPEYSLRPRPVTVATAEHGDLTAVNSYLGVVEPTQKADIAPRVTAAIENINVDEGDRVKVGDVLARLDADEVEHRLDALDSRIEQARAERSAQQTTVEFLESSVEYWKRERERARELAEENAIPGSEAEKTADRAMEVESNLQRARKNLLAVQHRIASLEGEREELRTKLEYYTLTSPTDGVVTRRMMDPGELASAGQPVVAIEARNSLRLTFDVPQPDLEEVSEGQPVTFSVGNSNRTVPLTLMYPSLNETRMMRAEAWLADGQMEGLTPGEYVPLSVEVDRHEDITLVPRSSLIESPEGRVCVFVVSDGRLEARRIEVLGYAEDRAGVSGLDAGSSVVKNTYLGWARLSAGEKVEAVQ